MDSGRNAVLDSGGLSFFEAPSHRSLVVDALVVDALVVDALVVDALVVAPAEPKGLVITGDNSDIGTLAGRADDVCVESI